VELTAYSCVKYFFNFGRDCYFVANDYFDDVCADDTTIIAVSAVFGGTAFVAAVIVIQFIR